MDYYRDQAGRSYRLPGGILGSGGSKFLIAIRDGSHGQQIVFDIKGRRLTVYLSYLWQPSWAMTASCLLLLEPSLSRWRWMMWRWRRRPRRPTPWGTCRLSKTFVLALTRSTCRLLKTSPLMPRGVVRCKIRSGRRVASWLMIDRRAEWWQECVRWFLVYPVWSRSSLNRRREKTLWVPS